MASFWEEMKRRNVVKVAIAYAIASWLILQLTDVLIPILQLPEWVGGLVFLILAIGFVLAIILSWAYELTPDGVKLEKDVDRSISITHSSGRKLDFAIIGALVVALMFFAFDKFVQTESVTSTTASTSAQRTIAVLPFVNMSDDPKQEYFSDGLAEELLNLLAKIPQLRVTSRTSAFSFKGKDVTIVEVGRELNVEHVLEGSVRRSGDTIRITAQLINVSTDTHEWSNTWDRKFNDVFAIQDEIAQSVVGALKLRLVEDMPVVKETTPEAYALFLQGRFLLQQLNAPSFLQAESLFERVLDADPGYSPAWSALSRAYFMGSVFGAREPVDAIPLIRRAAKSALRLDETNALAHSMLAHMAMRFDHDHATAAREFEIALNLAPRDPFVLMSAASFARIQGRFEDAILLAEKAHTIDPLAGHKTGIAVAYFYSGRQEEAISLWKEAIRMTPFADFLHRNLGLALLETGDVDGALAALEKENSDGHRLSGLALMHESMGDHERSREELEKLIALGNRWTFEIAEVHAFRGELDEAFLWMDRAVDRYDGSLSRVMYSPYLNKLRDDPRFGGLLERLGYKSKS